MTDAGADPVATANAAASSARDDGVAHVETLRSVQRMHRFWSTDALKRAPIEEALDLVRTPRQ